VTNFIHFNIFKHASNQLKPSAVKFGYSPYGWWYLKG